MIQNNNLPQSTSSQKVLGQIYAQLIRLARQKKLASPTTAVTLNKEAQPFQGATFDHGADHMQEVQL